MKPIAHHLLLLLAFCGTNAVAQRRAYPPPLPGAFAIIEPRTRVEEFEARTETILVKGSGRVAILNSGGNIARVEAIEVSDSNDSARATGIAIWMPNVSRQTDGPRASRLDNRAVLDYEEIDPLLKAIDTMVKTGDTVTKLTFFEVRYRTRGDLEAIVFRQTSGGVAAAIAVGYFEKTTMYISLDELTKFRHMIAEAKMRLDELK